MLTFTFVLAYTRHLPACWFSDKNNIREDYGISAVVFSFTSSNKGGVTKRQGRHANIDRAHKVAKCRNVLLHPPYLLQEAEAVKRYQIKKRRAPFKETRRFCFLTGYALRPVVLRASISE